MALSETAAANIRAEMARRQLKQTEVAEPAGLTQPLLSDRLRKPHKLTVDELAAIADALRMDIADLLGLRIPRTQRAPSPAPTTESQARP